MIQEIDIYGIFVPSLLVFALIAAAATMLLRRALVVVGFYRLVWHRSLFDLALFTIVLGVVFLLFEGAGSRALPVLSFL